MYALVTLGIALIPFIYYYYKSFSLTQHFTSIKKFSFLWLYLIFIFTYLLIALILLFIDVLSNSASKEYLALKEEIGLYMLLVFIINTLYIVPFIISYFIKSVSNYLLIYYIFLTLLNGYNFLYPNSKNVNFGYGLNVPDGLAEYSYIKNSYEKFVYFNFGILAALGKFIGFTYMPYGMSKWVSGFIYQNGNDKNDNEYVNIECIDSTNEETNLLNSNTKIINSIEKDNQMHKTKFVFGILSFVLIIFIIVTKIEILYTKCFYNICGYDCGFLAFRFDNDFLNLESLMQFANKFSYEKLIQCDFFTFAYIVLFRMMTVICSIKEKGVAFLSHNLIKQNKDMKDYELFILMNVIIYTGIVLLYDFTYLLPDYLRFNNLDTICDYSNISKPYCGVSFFGLLFMKISMNYHWFMIWDIVASMIFITNSTIWAYRLILAPFVNYIDM